MFASYTSTASRSSLIFRQATRNNTSNLGHRAFTKHSFVLARPSHPRGAPPPKTPRPSLRPQRAVINPLSFLAAFTASFTVAYFVTQYTDQTHQHPDQQLSTLAEEQQEQTAPTAHSEILVMVANMPPGRPGNLTADQEARLKEMWAQTLEIFGVSGSTHPRNSIETPSTATDSPDKKKKGGRLSLFKRGKNKEGPDTDGDNGEYDKHGQMKEYQQALASQSPEELREAFWSMVKHDHPDALLLRFLRARKWDVHAAIIMLISTMHWRSKEMHVDDDIMKNGEGHAIRESKSSNAAEKKEGDDLMAQLRMGKSFLHGADKEGRPCCYVRVKLHRQGEQSEKSLERFTVYTIETARMLLRPPVDTATIVFDMTDFSMANMDYTPVKFMIKCFEANYPESLGSVLVYKSPWIFQGIWKIIRGWLDPVVASKVHFCSNVDELSQWIPRSQIMKELGGDEDFVYKYPEPVGDEDAQMKDTAARDPILEERKQLVKSYEGETMAWIGGEGAGEGRSRLAQRIAENYWRLDPYVRSRSLYDRSGVLGKEGKLDFYPAKSAAAAKAGHDNELD